MFRIGQRDQVVPGVVLVRGLSAGRVDSLLEPVQAIVLVGRNLAVLVDLAGKVTDCIVYYVINR